MVEYIYDAQIQDRRDLLYPGFVDGCFVDECGRDSELSEHFVQSLESDGFDQAMV
jgi:hypothetical protein